MTAPNNFFAAIAGGCPTAGCSSYPPSKPSFSGACGMTGPNDATAGGIARAAMTAGAMASTAIGISTSTALGSGGVSVPRAADPGATPTGVALGCSTGASASACDGSPASDLAKDKSPPLGTKPGTAASTTTGFLALCDNIGAISRLASGTTSSGRAATPPANINPVIKKKLRTRMAAPRFAKPNHILLQSQAKMRLKIRLACPSETETGRPTQ